MKNPFCLKPLPEGAAFCNREKEITELTRHAINCVNVVISAPRRYGKTSLVRRVQAILKRKAVNTVYIDFFGASNIEDISSRMAAGIYASIYKKESLFKKAFKFFSHLRPVIKPDPEAGISITMEVAKNVAGIDLLEETMKGLSEFLKKSTRSFNIALDEFQEITELKESGQIEGILRSYIQHQKNVSYFFVGSRRRILLDIFNNRKRPFYKSAINMTLMQLPRNKVVEYLTDVFGKNGKDCPQYLAGEIYDITEGNPYYIQKLSYYVFEKATHRINKKTLNYALRQMLYEETPLFEAMLQNLRPGQMSFLYSLAKESTKTPFKTDYLLRHHLGSMGGVQAAIKKLVSLDYIEKTAQGWKVVDPIFALWLRNRKKME